MAELHKIVLTVKAVLGARIFMRELNVAPTGPTPLRTDAQDVVDAARSLRVSLNRSGWRRATPWCARR